MELVIELPRLFNYSCHHCLQKPVGDVGFFFPSHYPGALKAGVMCQGWI